MQPYQHILAVLLLFVVSLSGMAQAPATFENAKGAMRKVYSASPETFYCGCAIQWTTASAGYPNLKTCGYKVRKDAKRASRIEWEHIMPAHAFGQHRACWQAGGRKNCASDPVFRRMEADMHNLAPAIGEINNDRSNFRFGLLPATPRQHGDCPFKVEFQQRVAEPRAEIRGQIARTYFYMHDRYNLRLSDAQERLFMAWDKQYPVTDEERKRHEHIAQYMGNSNPFVTGKRRWSRGYKPMGKGDSAVPGTSTAARSPGDTGQAIAPKPVHGNRNSRVYHLPEGCPSYLAMKPANRIAFQTEAEARAAGYRKAGNCS